MYAKTLLTSIFAVSLVGFSPGLLAEEMTSAWETPTSFSAPESALFDAKNNLIYISNVGGNAMEKDGNGFVATLDTNGNIVNDKWVTGLNGPTGMTQFGDNLYVCDIDTLIEINVTSGEITNRYQGADAKFLNDVTVNEDGVVYATDMMGNAVYRLMDGKLEQWVQSDTLENPNGIHAEKDKLIVGAWGKLGAEGFATEIPGHLKTVMYSDGAISSLGNGSAIGNLDGVESDGSGNYYVTDWIAGKLLHITPAGESTEMLSLAQGAADHEVILDQNLVIIPMMMENKVVAYKLK